MDELILLIEDYLFYVKTVAQIFSEEFDVEISEIIWERNKKIPFKGAIKHKKIIHYSFHGIGLAAKYKKKNIDFDFYFDGDKCNIDGFDSWRLRNFAENDGVKYSQFLIQSQIEEGLKLLKESGLIVKPKTDSSTTLWILNKSNICI